MKTKTKTKVFEVTSGRLVLGDPCYETNPTFKARKGLWTARVVKGDKGFWGERVQRVFVHHVDFDPSDTSIRVKRQNFSVDSGQAGVFDKNSYGGEEFYDQCCKSTLTKKQYGFLRNGFVTSSGYGDGCYFAKIHKISGEAVCLEIVFIIEN